MSDVFELERLVMMMYEHHVTVFFSYRLRSRVFFFLWYFMLIILPYRGLLDL